MADQGTPRGKSKQTLHGARSMPATPKESVDSPAAVDPMVVADDSSTDSQVAVKLAGPAADNLASVAQAPHVDNLFGDFEWHDAKVAMTFTNHEQSPCSPVDLMLKGINSAKTTLWICMFDIHDVYVQHIVAAKERKVDVRIVYNEKQMDAKVKALLEEAKMKMIAPKIKGSGKGYTPETDRYPGEMHEKVIIVDKLYVIFGSANLSNRAKKNYENAMIAKGPIVDTFIHRFNTLWGETGYEDAVMGMQKLKNPSY